MPTARNKGGLVPLADGSLDLDAVLTMLKNGERLHIVEDPSDDAAVAVDMLQRTLGATSADELFSEEAGESISGKDYVERPFRIDRVKFRNSDRDDGLGIYAIFEGVDFSGAPIVVTSGSSNVLVEAIKGVQLGAWPRWVRITEDTTKSGNTVNHLRGAKAPTTDADGLAF
jgi:hypothetical protein